MSTRILHVRLDPTARGGARADAVLRVPSVATVLFQGFDLAGLAAYAAVTSGGDDVLTEAAPVEIYGGGNCGRAEIDCTGEWLKTWLEESSAGIRIGIFTETDGWLAFADVQAERLPPLPEVSGSGT